MRQLSIHPSIHPAYRLIRTSSARIHHIQPCSAPRFQALAKLPLSEGPNLGDSDLATTMYEIPCEYMLRCFRWVLLSDDIVCMSKEWVDVGGWPIGGFRIKMSKNRKNRAAIYKQKKWWRSTCLASWLSQIWHSRPLSCWAALVVVCSGEPNIAPAGLGGSLCPFPILVPM